jgi:hypothetical protein
MIPKIGIFGGSAQMAKSLKLLSFIFIVTVIVAGLGLSGCSQAGNSASSPSVQQPSSSSTPPSSTGGQSATPATQQQGNTSSGQRGSRGQGGQNMSAVLNKAADILGISETTFTSAFNAAQTSVFGSRPSGTSSQPPQRPSGSENWSGQGSRPTSGGSGGQPSQGQSSMMTKVYAQMATTLNISADQISAAMQQAMTQLQSQTGSSQ